MIVELEVHKHILTLGRLIHQLVVDFDLQACAIDADRLGDCRCSYVEFCANRLDKIFKRTLCQIDGSVETFRGRARLCRGFDVEASSYKLVSSVKQVIVENMWTYRARIVARSEDDSLYRHQQPQTILA